MRALFTMSNISNGQVIKMKIVNEIEKLRNWHQQSNNRQPVFKLVEIYSSSDLQ